MKKIYLIAASLISCGLFAQNIEAPMQHYTAKTMKAKMENNKAVNDTLGLDEFFNAGQPVIFGINGADGYVNGTYWVSGTPGNSHGAFVGYINYGKYTVEGILAWLGVKDYPGAGNSTIISKVLKIDGTTSYSSGGVPIYSGPAPLTQVGGNGSTTVAAIDTNSNGANGFVYMPLLTPANIEANSGDWGVFLNWTACYAAGDTVGFVLSADNPSVTYTNAQDYVFQYYLPGSLDWVRFYDAWQSWALNIPAIWPCVETKVGMPEDYNLKGAMLYQNVPNPSTDFTRISYSVKENMMASFEIIDAQGKRIYFDEGVKAAGKTYNVDFNKGDLAPGIYFYSLATNGHRLTMKMVIAE